MQACPSRVHVLASAAANASSGPLSASSSATSAAKCRSISAMWPRSSRASTISAPAAAREKDGSGTVTRPVSAARGACRFRHAPPPRKQPSSASRHSALGRSKYTPRRPPAAGSMPRTKR